MANLNPQQNAAVKHHQTPLLVLAGAGSGKTRVITEKIGYLTNTLGYAGKTIFAVTFTNKAAQEMKSRLAALLGSRVASQVNVSTFHTLGLKLLQREGHHLGLTSSLTIMDAGDSQSLLKELRQEQSVAEDSSSEDGYQWEISRLKNDFISAEEALANAETDREQLIARLYARYDQLLRAYNAVDFDDLIVLPVRLLQENAGVREKSQHHVRHLLVDEYQDTNAVQYEFVKLLMGNLGKFTAVGDDDQSIYAWRGARPENLARLQQDFPTLKLIKLEQNYRSSARILHSANTLIANNPHLFDKKLWSELGMGDPLRVVACKSADDECDWLAAELMHHKMQHRTKFSDYAILYRGNFQARGFEKALRGLSIPYKVSGGRSFFEHTEIKDLLAYLRLMANPKDDTAFLRIVNVPRREIGAATLEKLSHYARQRNVPMLHACTEMGLASSLSERALSRLQNFAHWIILLADNAERGDPIKVIHQLIDDSHYQGWLRETSATPNAAERRWANVQELLAWIERLAEDDPSGSLSEMVAHFSLMDILERQNEEEEYDAVSMMTLHASKGLEFPYVYIAGMEEELLPHRTSIDEDNIEEERRLAYVGITRGQRNVTFTYAKQRNRYGEILRCEPSRFLEELPPDDLVWVGGKNEKIDPEQTKQSGRAALSGLKALLNNSEDASS